MRGDTRHRRATGARWWRHWARGLGVVAVLLGATAAGPKKGKEPSTGDDLIFRPTVIVRKGTGQGSGTIIASVDGETLVLTAAHVVREAGPIGVELHRYNLGVEQAIPRGGWPVTLPAEVAASDPAADVAVVRIRGRPALPFVARLGAPGDEPGPEALVTSVGIDGGSRLESWSTRVYSSVWFAMVPDARPGTGKRAVAGARAGTTGTRFRQPSRPGRDAEPFGPGERPFLLTARAPEHGRAGGGLCLDGGRLVLVGVCVGRFELDNGKAVGVFASGQSVRRLLRLHDLETVVERSEAGREKETGDRRQETGGKK